MKQNVKQALGRRILRFSLWTSSPKFYLHFFLPAILLTLVGNIAVSLENSYLLTFSALSLSSISFYHFFKFVRLALP